MKTQEYLKQLSRLEYMIERKQDEAYKLEVSICGVPGMALDPNKVQTSISGDRMSSAVAKLVDAKKDIDKLISFYIEKRKYIISQIDAIPNGRSYVVLTDIYVRHMTLCEIAGELNCSESAIKKAHAKALKEFEEIYGDDYVDNPTVFS